MWVDLRQAGHVAAASRLDSAADHGELTDVDYVRVVRVIRQARGDEDRLAAVAAEIEDAGPHAWLHPSGQRDLPARLGEHDLMTGQVRLGVASASAKNPATHAGQTFALDAEVLRTSLLVIGPTGSGKTRSFARPIVELLGLQTLTNMASVVVIDPHGDYALPGFFDVDIDPLDPDSQWGFDLYGGARNPAEAADRLAGALLPPGVEPEADAAAHNGLDAALSWFREREGRYPTLKELIAELVEGGPRLLVERLRLLDRPALVELFDGRGDRKFSMRQIDKPMRVRIALPEGAYPQAARILARLAVSQFVQTVSAPDVDRSIFKGLIVDDAGRFVDEYVVQGLQRARAANAGLILLAQSMREFPEDLRATVFANTGCKAVFAGIDPQDASYIADFWGKQWVAETTVTTGQENTTRTGTITGPPERAAQRAVDGPQRQAARPAAGADRRLVGGAAAVGVDPAGGALRLVALGDHQRDPDRPRAGVAGHGRGLPDAAGAGRPARLSARADRRRAGAQPECQVTVKPPDADSGPGAAFVVPPFAIVIGSGWNEPSGAPFAVAPVNATDPKSDSGSTPRGVGRRLGDHLRRGQGRVVQLREDSCATSSWSGRRWSA